MSFKTRTGAATITTLNGRVVVVETTPFPGLWHRLVWPVLGSWFGGERHRLSSFPLGPCTILLCTRPPTLEQLVHLNSYNGIHKRAHNLWKAQHGNDGKERHDHSDEDEWPEQVEVRLCQAPGPLIGASSDACQIAE